MVCKSPCKFARDVAASSLIAIDSQSLLFLCENCRTQQVVSDNGMISINEKASNPKGMLSTNSFILSEITTHWERYSGSSMLSVPNVLSSTTLSPQGV